MGPSLVPVTRRLMCLPQAGRGALEGGFPETRAKGGQQIRQEEPPAASCRASGLTTGAQGWRLVGV